MKPSENQHCVEAFSPDRPSGDNVSRRHKSSSSSSSVDYRRYMSVPEGVTEFINQYKIEASDAKSMQKYVSLVDREHKRLYGACNNEDMLHSSSVPKSATSQQIQEIYSKMGYERAKLGQRLAPSCSDSAYMSPFNSSVSSEEYVTPLTSPGEVPTANHSPSSFPSNGIHPPVRPGFSVLNLVPPPPGNASFSSDNQNRNIAQTVPSTGIMQSQYVQSPGTVFTPISVPPMNVGNYETNTANTESMYQQDAARYIQMGHVPPMTACKPPLISSAPKNGIFSDGQPNQKILSTPLKISKIPSCERPSDPVSPSKLSQAFEMSLDSNVSAQEDKLKGMQKFFSSPRFSKKHLRAKSPMCEKKKPFKQRRSPLEAHSPLPEATTERKFLGSPRLGRAFFGSPKATRKQDFQPPIPRDEILLPRLVMYIFS